MELLREYRRRYWLHLFSIALFVVPLFIVTTQTNPKDQTLFGMPPQLWNIGFFVCMIAGVLLNLIWWRCPACQHYLSRATNPPACPKCGAAFR